MGFVNFSSFFEVLTISSFAYAGAPKVTAFFDNNFYKLSTPPLYKRLHDHLQNSWDLIRSELFILSQSQVEDDDIQNQTNYAQRVFETHQETLNRNFEIIHRQERVCNLFRRTLKPIYLMSAFFGLFMLIILGAESHLKNETGSAFEASMFVIECLVMGFILYSIFTFRPNRILLISSNLTLYFFVLFVASFIILYHYLPVDFSAKYSPRMHIIGILSLFLVAFPFIFHFLRQMQIKYLYSVKLLVAYWKVRIALNKDRRVIIRYARLLRNND